MFKSALYVVAVGASLLFGSQSFGAMSFTNDLTSFAGLSSDLEEADTTTATRDIVYTAAGAVLGSVDTGNDGRNYIRTTAIDFDSVSFVAKVSVATPGRFFFGLGAGEIGAFGTPDWDVAGADSIWIETLTNGWSIVQDSARSDLTGDEGPPFDPGLGAVDRQYTLAYDAVNKTVQFTALDDADGSTPNVSPLLDVSALFTGSEAGRVYVGGGEGVTLSDFEVTVTVPEPASVALIAMGGVLMVGRLGSRRG